MRRPIVTNLSGKGEKKGVKGRGKHEKINILSVHVEKSLANLLKSWGLKVLSACLAATKSLSTTWEHKWPKVPLCILVITFNYTLQVIFKQKMGFATNNNGPTINNNVHMKTSPGMYSCKYQKWVKCIFGKDLWFDVDNERISPKWLLLSLEIY